MATTYRIIPERNLVIIEQRGFVTIADNETTFAAFVNDPRRRPGQNHLVDCSGVTGFEDDLVKFFKLQAKVAGTVTAEQPEMLLVILAPNDPARQIARLIHNTWNDTPTVRPRIAASEREALSILGHYERQLADLPT